MDLLSILVDNLHQKSIEASVLPGGPERLEDGAGRRNGSRHDELSCVDGEERRMEAMMASHPAKVQREWVDVHQEGLRGGQRADGPSGSDACAVGVHEAPSKGTVEGKALEIDRVGALDHITCGQKLGEQGRGGARDGERCLPMKV